MSVSLMLSTLISYKLSKKLKLCFLMVITFGRPSDPWVTSLPLQPYTLTSLSTSCYCNQAICVSFVSLSVMSSRPIHAVAYCRISCLLIGEQYSGVYIFHFGVFLHLPLVLWISCLPMMNNIAKNIGI